MTLDATEPTDQREINELPYYIRLIAAAVNALEVGETEVVVTNLTVSTGDTALVVGTDLSSAKIEFVIITGLGVSVLEQITGGTEGQLKILIFQNGNLSLLDGLKESGKFYLNHLPALSNFAAQQDDVIALFNIDGDGSSNNGYWKELFRLISVK